jgi:putative IMPACT (imprinted ancient) family translation regulator
LIIVVRYFGGTLLGVQGLIHAYKSAAAAVLEKSPLLYKDITTSCRIECDYTALNEVMQVLKQEKIAMTEKNIGLYCDIVALIPVEKKESLINSINALPGCTVKEMVDQ